MSAGLQLNIRFYPALIIIIHFTISFQTGHQLEWLALLVRLIVWNHHLTKLTYLFTVISPSIKRWNELFMTSLLLTIGNHVWRMGPWTLTRSRPSNCPSKYPNSCLLSRIARGDKIRIKRSDYHLNCIHALVSMLGVQMETRQMSIQALIFEPLVKLQWWKHQPSFCCQALIDRSSETVQF